MPINASTSVKVADAKYVPRRIDNYKKYLKRIQCILDKPITEAEKEIRLVHEKGIDFNTPLYSTLPIDLKSISHPI